MKPTARRARQSREATATELLDAAEGLFIERGYAATTVADVVKRANVTTGALYHAFPDKQALFSRVAQRVVESLIAQVAAELDVERDPWRQLEVGMQAILAASSGPRVRLAFIEAPVALGLEKWRAIEQAATAPLLGAALSRLVSSRQLTPHRAQLVGRVLRGAMLEAAMAVAESPRPAPVRKELLGLLAAMLAAFRREARRSR